MTHVYENTVLTQILYNFNIIENRNLNNTSHAYILLYYKSKLNESKRIKKYKQKIQTQTTSKAQRIEMKSVKFMQPDNVCA